MTFYNWIGVAIAAGLIMSPAVVYVLSYAASEAYHASKLRYQMRFMHHMAQHPKPNRGEH